MAGSVILLWGWRRTLTAGFAGATSALAMAPFDLFVILFATFPVLVWLIDGTAADAGAGRLGRARAAAFVGWWFGFGYFLGGLWWIGNALLVEADQFAWALPLAVVALPAALALFWAAACGLASVWWSDDWRRIVLLAAFVGLAEWLRSIAFTGFPWNAIGYAAMTSTVTQQSVSVVGLYAVNTLAVLLFSMGGIFAPRSQKTPRRARALLAVGLVLIAAHVAFGAWRLAAHPTRFVEDAKLRLVQPAIDQREKWLPGKEADIFRLYLSLSAKGDNVANDLAGITHLIWPESAFPFLLTERPDALAAIADLLPPGTTLITGAARIEPGVAGRFDDKIFNSVMAINDRGEITAAADKVHLVPFGEYLPFHEQLEALGLRQLAGSRGGFAPGAARTTMSTGIGGAFLPLICYEVIFPGRVLDGASDPQWLVNLTNDAWFGSSPGPYQHHRQAVVRGIEEGLPVVRVANSGISSVSDAYGRELISLPLGARGSVDSALPEPAAETMFRRFGNLPFWLLSALMIVSTVRFARRR